MQHPAQQSATILVIGGDIGAFPPAAARTADFPVQLRLAHVPEEPVHLCRDVQPALLVIDTNGAPEPLGLVANIQAASLPLTPAIIIIGDEICPDMRMAALAMGVTAVMEHPTYPAELWLRLLGPARLGWQYGLLTHRAADQERRLAEVLDLLRQTERQLAHMSRSDSNPVATIATAAHELRTPLNAILGFAELIRDQAHGALGDPRYAEYAEDIHAAGQHMQALVDGTLDLARAETGQEQLELRNVDIGRTVQESARLVRQMAETAGIELDVTIPETPLHIRTDPEKVRQIVLNLASNAIKFTPRGGRVGIMVEGVDEGGAVILVIRDTGIGIASQDMATAMRPYGRVRSAQAPAAKGTGLGLPLTRRFVEMLGGSMTISSNPGMGTVVTVRLPPDLPAATLPSAAPAA